MVFNGFGIHIQCLITKVTTVYVARMSGRGPSQCSGKRPGGGKGDKGCSGGSEGTGEQEGNSGCSDQV
jgi:hypothetical protein